MSVKTNITGIILAGGKSTRMGSDKGLILYKNKPFTQHIIDAMTPLVSNILIVSNNIAYDVFNTIRINDDIQDAGPLSGLYSGLNYSKTEYNMVLSCDVPLIETIVLQKLVDSISSEIDVLQIESNSKTMPLVGIYKKNCSNKFLELLNNNQLRVKEAINFFKTKNIVLENHLAKTVTNINTKEQLNCI